MKLMTCVCDRTQIKVGTNYLQVIFHMSTVSHVCMSPTHRIKSFLKMGQTDREQMDRGTGRETGLQTRGASDTKVLW